MQKYRRIPDQEYLTEQTLYHIGLVGAVVVLIVEILLTKFSFHSQTVLGEIFGVCPFYRLTHLYCPGCGGTRALFSLLHGNILKSLRYNAFVTYVVICYLCFMVSYTIRVVSKRRVNALRFRMVYIYFGVFVLLFNWIIKNAISL